MKLNTTAVKLTPFDIVVAQVEETAGESLHDLVNKLRAEVSAIDNYIAPEDLILSIAAMREDRSPSQSSYQKIDLKRLVDEWNKLVAGIKWAVKTLEDEHIYDASRLPTVAVLYVLSAISEYVPPVLDSHANARALIRKYLWRAFLTSRYENAAATMALQDFRGLRAVLSHGGDPDNQVPIFNERQYPLPEGDVLMGAGWPKGREIIARGILAISIKAGAFDLADGERATRSHLPLREYHHLFPDSLLTDEGQMTDAQSFKALNCALVTWNTNRNISAKEPLKYLKERTERAALGEEVVKARLRSHVIPYKELNVGGYASISNPRERAASITTDYTAFLRARAAMIIPAMEALCDGQDWPQS